MHPIYTFRCFVLKQYCFYIAKANGKLEIILQMTGYICSPLHSKFHLLCLNDVPPTPRSSGAEAHIICLHTFIFFAHRRSHLSLSFLFFCHILSNLFSESHKSHSQFNEFPLGSARKKKCAPLSTTLMSMQCSDISPVVWHAKGKHTLCIHQSQTVSDRGYSATVARYVKSPRMSFSLHSARVICKYNDSGLHGLIQSKGSI